MCLVKFVAGDCHHVLHVNFIKIYVHKYCKKFDQYFSQVLNKTLKGKKFIGIACGKFHTLMFTETEVYSCGLNAGQLGRVLENKNNIVYDIAIVLKTVLFKDFNFIQVI